MDGLRRIRETNKNLWIFFFMLNYRVELKSKHMHIFRAFIAVGMACQLFKTRQIRPTIHYLLNVKYMKYSV